MTKSKNRSAGLSPILFAMAFGAYASATHAEGRDKTIPGHDHAASADADIMARMMAGMAIPPSGDADVDFARGMIPHHQGAIDMARQVLERGDDPQIRQLAEDVIAAQEAEIRFLEDWLQDHAPAE